MPLSVCCEKVESPTGKNKNGVALTETVKAIVTITIRFSLRWHIHLRLRLDVYYLSLEKEEEECVNSKANEATAAEMGKTVMTALN